MDILDQTLIWNKKGIIQGPLESDADFQKRAHYLESFKKTISEFQQITEEEQEKGDRMVKEAFAKTRPLYDIEPIFVPIFFSNKQLSFFHGGTSWIVQIRDDDPIGAFIQLKKNKVPFYEAQEILVHELAHVGRMAYECPAFEEILAWRSSKNSFRRYCGPLFSSVKETALLAFLLITLFLMDIFSLAFGNESAFFMLQWFKIIPGVLIVLAGIRLYFRQRAFSSCLFKLQNILGEAGSMAVIYRLSDQEIFRFSKESADQILSYAATNAERSLRWKTLYAAYFFSFV